MKAVLFRTLAEDGSFSMQRYASELLPAMLRVAGDRWQIREFVCHQPRIATRLVRGGYGKHLDSAVTRYAIYPWQASKTRGDIFHILDHGYAQLLWRLDPRRTVVTCHDLIPLLAKSGVITMPIAQSVIWTFRLRLWFMARAACVIADSESTGRDVLRFSKVSPDRVVVISPGVSHVFCPAEDPEAVRATRCSLGIPEGEMCILHVGSRGRYKNTPALIRALHLLNFSMGLSVWLLRTGADFYPDEQELINRLGLKNRLVHLGVVPSDEILAGLYRSADVFVFPSLWEGFGWPPLEAMACGIPVVASNAASLPEVIGDAGLMVDPCDYEGLAQAIAQVLTNEELRKVLITGGLKRAQQFSWERTAKRTLEVYDRVLQEAESADRY